MFSFARRKAEPARPKTLDARPTASARVARRPAFGSHARAAQFSLLPAPLRGAASAAAPGSSIQAKLAIGRVDDPEELEADRVADEVVQMRTSAMADPSPAAGSPGSSAGTPRVRRACAACDQAKGSPAPSVTEQEEEESVRRRQDSGAEPANAAAGDDALSGVDRVLRSGGGRPLDATARSFMEPRFGLSFSSVQVHTTREAAASARALGAQAYTVGEQIVFGEGHYQPDTLGGKHLLAHELAHVVQQSPAIRSRRASGQQGGRDGGVALPAPVQQASATLRAKGEPATTLGPSSEFLDAGWTDVNELGIAFTEGGPGVGGANLRKSPSGELIRWLKPNTKVFILKEHAATDAYAVSVLREGGSAGEFGYVWRDLIWRRLPDPESDVVKIHGGESPIEIAANHYKSRGFDVWAKDLRYVVNALVWVNQRAQHNAGTQSGISKEAVDDKWYTAQSTAGVYIWLPGAAFMNAIYDEVVQHGGGTGSITGDLWEKVKRVGHWIAYGIAFVGGLLHGFGKSLVDAVVGLVTTAKDVLVSIFTGEVLSDAKELWDAISSITWDQIKEAVGSWADAWNQKLQSKSPWVAGHAHGYLTGYVMAEAAQLLLSGGTLTALKGALWTSRLGKAIKATSAMRRLAAGVEKAGEAGSKLRKGVEAAGSAIVKSRAFKVLAQARKWVGDALLLSAETLGDLSLEAINRLRSLSDDALEKLRALAQPFKRVVLGCASPCKVDMDVVNDWVKALAAKVASHSKPLGTVEEVLAALPAGLNKTKIEKQLRKHPALIRAIEKAGLTAEDFDVIKAKNFLTPADLTNAETAYETFTRTLTTLVPAKVGPDVEKMLEISKAIYLLEPRYASSLKGPLFETFAKLHLGRFRGIRFGRATWNKADHPVLRKSRTSDGFIDSANAIWDFKDTSAKLAGGGQMRQLDDYYKILTQGLTSVDGKKAKSVNFVFSTLEGAQANRDLLTKGFNVFYVTPPDVVSKLK